jgi:serine phosphatase RsbU (regulator of sigma subunit)
MKNLNFKLFLFCANLILVLNVNSQDLINNNNYSKQDTSTVRKLIELSEHYQDINPDSQLFCLNKAIVLATTLKNNVSIADCNVNIGLFHAKSNNFNKALRYFTTSLKLYRKEKDKKGIIDCLINIGLVYNYQDDYPSSIKYISIALLQSIEIADNKRTGKCYNNLGMTYSSIGNSDSSKICFNEAIRLYKTIDNQKGLASCYGNLANLYFDLGKHQLSIDYNIKALQISEKLNNKSEISNYYNNIGLVYENIENYEKAIEYYTNSLNIAIDIKDSLSIAYSYGNIGNAYTNTKKFKEAEIYLNKCLDILIKLNQLHGIATCYSSIGIIEAELGNLYKSESYLLNALKINLEIDNKPSIIVSYNNLSGLYVRLKQYNKAIDFALKGAALSEELGAVRNRIFSYQYLYSTYDSLGDYKKAYYYHKLFKQYNDSINNEQNYNNINDIEAKYQNEKKQLKIENLEKEDIIKTSKLQKQLILIISFVIGFVLILLFSILLYRLFLQKKKANILLAKRNTEVLQQKEEISTQRDEIEAQRDEIEAQRDLVTIQKESIEEIHKEVTDSINYAKRIQEAVLPISIESRSVLGEHFILFKPKDIVSGDFYWTVKINNLLFVAVADCTGHGVPGAFMSMLGISFLNEIVHKQEIKNPNQILNHLREEIVYALQQKGVQGEQKDGMDISLLVVNTDTNEAQWAGANNPLYIISSVILNVCEEQFSCEAKSISSNIDSSQAQIDNRDIMELKGNKMPIAIYPQMKDFTSHEFSLQKGDSVYLFTDGYADQFGGPSGRKFMYKQFKEMLLQNNNKPMKEQREILEFAFENWKGEFEQIDDVTILGIRI